MSNWSIILLTLLCSAFAAGSEIAFISVNKLRIELDRSQGSFAARIIWNFIKSPSNFIATMLIANNIALVIYGTVMAEEILSFDILRSYLPKQLHGEASLLIIQTLTSTLIILVAAEFIPKALFRINPNGILRILAVPLQVMYYVLYPVMWVIMGISRFFMR
ncbi:MAG TPA: DUF21 domain-containing protein, partial [Bacteroidia bacterium]|nr:DUF21 domain-containing protein [Bacteroidia bacterium]